MMKDLINPVSTRLCEKLGSVISYHRSVTLSVFDQTTPPHDDHGTTANSIQPR